MDVALHVTARRRYLNYAMSVITSRALPDVRDGLKPVQRRILYTMRNELRIGPSTKPLKCARIVGDVLGKFHPHGDSSVYEALVRMAQDFSLRYPLIDGHGNFGSIDGDSAAAYRYTEARLQKLAIELLEELPKETVDFRPNYDGKTREPIVLPSRIPNLLINGATGIAVGMATNIPPHNLGEVAEACEALVRRRRLKVADLLKFIKGPDFPTGGQILNTRRELSKIYREGHGSVKVRGEYKLEGGVRRPRIVITSIPYMVQKDVLVRSIGELIGARKIPQINDVRDESTTDVRIVLEMKQGAEPDAVMAYLFKNTNLQNNFNVNLTCLIPASDEDPDRCKPARLDLRQILLHFIRFRYKVVVRRLEHDLRLLKERIHILEGFKKIFNALDTAIKIIRNSNGREDAAKKLKKRFKLDDIQVNAILDLRLYKLAKLEIKGILDELLDKKKRAREIEKILKSEARLWTIVHKEIAEARKNPTKLFKALYAWRTERKASGIAVPIPVKQFFENDENLLRVGDYIRGIDAELARIDQLKTGWEKSRLRRDLEGALKKGRKKATDDKGTEILSKLETMVGTLRGHLGNAELYKVEMLTAQQDLYDAAYQGRLLDKIAARKLDPVVPEGYRFWPFQGEYWVDELGWYEVVTINECLEIQR